jgi:hypothetical protein
MEQHDCDESRTLFEIHAERSQNCQRFCKTLSQQKHVVIQSTAALQLDRFNVASNMAYGGIRSSVAEPEKNHCRKIS